MKERKQKLLEELRNLLDYYHYPKSQIQEHGGIPQNTMYIYVSNSFLNGLVNYSGIKKAYAVITEDYDIPSGTDLPGILESLNKFHTKVCEDLNAVLIGETDSSYWVYFYDRDNSDCSIIRVEKYCKFDEFVEVILLMEKENQGFVSIHEHNVSGWISG